VAEVIGTSTLKASEGFIRLLPSVVVLLLGYAVAICCLSLVLKRCPWVLPTPSGRAWASCSSPWWRLWCTGKPSTCPGSSAWG
jgi:hypothetical protein